MAKKVKLYVCTKSHCKKRGSKKILSTLEKKVEEFKLEERVCVKKSSCLGKCGRGPVVQVKKPYEVAYGNLVPDNVEDILKALKKKKLVKKLLLA